MGCTDSTIENHLYVRNPNKTFDMNPHQFPPNNAESQEKTLAEQHSSLLQNTLKQTESMKKNQFMDKGIFENSQQFLEELYELCGGNLQKFFSELQQKISQIYMSISKQTLQQMNRNILINNQSKIQISEEILWFNLNILKVASRKNQHKFNPTLFKQINKLQKNLVGYLKMKYPRGGQSFVPGDLMNVFREFDLSEDIEFDILKNSNTYFGTDDEVLLARQIKEFLNKIMNELDVHYPKFQKTMQEQVFVIDGDDGQKKTLNYKIGRKIPQNVPKYTDLDSNSLEINSPEIFRVIIKWMSYLEEAITAPNENINKKRNFKVFIEETETEQKVFDEINEDEYYDLINFELIEKIEKEKFAYHDENEALLRDMDIFNSHLIKLLDTSIRRQKYVPIRQMQIIKYSNLNAKFIAWVLAQKLMLALKKLTNVGRSFYNTKAMLNLDLIQFKVSDLMRCMVLGSKKQVLAVYSNLKRLQKQGTIKIIKMKNRLGTSLNDAMIIFTFKDTFLICEIQLILSDSTQKVNQKYKNIEILNHFFYELERSPYGILSQIAVLLAYKDSKVSYEDSITFQTNKVSIENCQKQHAKFVIELKEQKKPFICTKCTKFYFKFENIFLMKHCQQCNIFLCGKCIFQSDPQLEKSIVNKQISTEIDKSVSKTLTKLRNVLSSTGASTILQIFETPFKRMEQVFGPKKVQVSKLIDYLNTKMIKGQQELYFVLVNFRTGKAVFKSLIFKPAWKQITNPFDPSEQFTEKKILNYTSFDLILFYEGIKLQKPSKLEEFYKLEENMLHIFINEQSLGKILQKMNKEARIETIKISDFRVVVNVKKIVAKVVQNYKKEVDAQFQNHNKQKCTKTFKYASLHEVTANLPDLAGAKSILKLSDIGIYSSHLKFFKQIDWVLSIKQLKLTKNYLDSVNIVLQYCVNLERLYINQNWIGQLKFTKPLSKIQIINASNNQIKIIEGCDKIKSISKLLLEGNRLQQFPKCDFGNLKILSLKRNPIIDFNNVYQSNFPNLQQLYLHYSQLEEDIARPNVQADLVKVFLPFQKLKCFQSQSNFKQIIIKSKKIERLDLYRNKLEILTLSSIENLRFVNLSSNKLENLDFIFPSKSNNENNIIKEINLSSNLLVSVPVMKSTSLVKINFSRNFITEVNNLSVSLIPNLESIEISNNKITRIPQLNFPHLMQIDMKDNPLEKIDELKTSNLSALQILRFSNCGKIESLPTLNFLKLKQIEISFTDLDSLQDFALSKLPNLKTLNFLACTVKNLPALKFDSLNALSLDNSTFDDLSGLEKCQFSNLESLLLRSITIQNQQEQIVVDDITQAQKLQAKDMKKVEDNPKKFTCKLNFPKLKMLYLDQARVKSLQGLGSCNLPSLQTLSLSSCQFNKYPKLRFKNLKTLKADTCQISQIESIFTSQLSSLQSLDISNNNISKVNIPQSSTIRMLDLAYNKISEFSITKDLDHLVQLRLNSNSLTKFPLIKAKNLKILELGSNVFDDISNLSLCNLCSIEQLRLDAGDLVNCPFPVVKLDNVKNIFMRQLRINDIQNLSLSHLPLLQDLNFCYNQITSIPVLKLPMLKFLRLNQNRIEDISNLTKCQLPELTILELETNQIKSLPLMPFPNLKKIFMHKNQCTEFSQFLKSPIKSFSILNICENPDLNEYPILQCKFEQFYGNFTKLTNVVRVNEFKGLKKLQLNHNNITQIPRLNQKQLQMIQFQHNLLTDISQFAKGQYNFCQQFTVRGNKLRKIPVMQMQQLKKVYFNENEIQDIEDFLLKGNYPKLQMITVEHNQLKKISKLPFPMLKEIYITDNKNLEELTCFCLEEYVRLEMIVAHDTGIKKVQVLPQMPKLSKIWVSTSKLQEIQWFAKSAKNLPSLSFVNISDNKIKQMPALPFNSLQQLYANFNPIQNIDPWLSDQKQAFKKYITCQISLKAKTDDQFEQMKKRIEGFVNYPTISRFNEG